MKNDRTRWLVKKSLNWDRLYLRPLCHIPRNSPDGLDYEQHNALRDSFVVNAVRRVDLK